MPPKQMYTDKEHIDSRFDRLEEILGEQGKRVSNLESDIGAAKLLGKAAMGLVLFLGGAITWVAGLLPKHLWWGGHQ